MRDRRSKALTAFTFTIVLACLALFVNGVSIAQDAAHTVTDSAQRRVEIPQRISRLLAAGPPASILLYTLASTG